MTPWEFMEDIADAARQQTKITPTRRISPDGRITYHISFAVSCLKAPSDYSISRQEVSRIFGVPEGTLKRWEWEGCGPKCEICGSRASYKIGDLRHFIAGPGLAERLERRFRSRLSNLRLAVMRNDVARMNATIRQISGILSKGSN